jgi:hypothetical protein
MSKVQVLKNTIDFLVQLDQEQTWIWQQTRVKLKAFVNILHEEIRDTPLVENPLVGTQPPRGNAVLDTPLVGKTDPLVDKSPPPPRGNPATPHPLVDNRFGHTGPHEPTPTREQPLPVEKHVVIHLGDEEKVLLHDLFEELTRKLENIANVIEGP